MSDLKVNNFKWEKGINDFKYIELLKKNNDRMLAQYSQLATTAREQYNKGYEQGRADAEAEICRKFAERLKDKIKPEWYGTFGKPRALFLIDEVLAEMETE